MQAIISKISAIEMKIRKLIQNNEELAQENKKLLEENIKLKKELQDKFFQAGMADKYTEEDQMVSIMTKKERISILKSELDGYIGEVDECIKILEGQH